MPEGAVEIRLHTKDLKNHYMTPLELAQSYMEIFYSGKNLDRLYGIFAESLHFQGPFYQFESARAYVERLQADPPVGCTHEPLHTVQEEDKVNLIYLFRKGSLATPMSQLFECEQGRIKKILLVFDSGSF